MKNEDLISIIVPVYKAEQYISKCLESLLNQTHKKIEIILVDDGSPDKSGEICDEYAKKDNRIKVIHQTNAGVSAARNAGLEKATGEYISFVDSDDWLETVAYEKMLNKLKENQVDIVRCGFYKDGSDGVKEKEFIYPESIKLDLQEKRKEYIELFTSGKIDAGICYLLIKKECIKKISKFNTAIALGEDLIFELELICVSKSIYLYNERFYHYFTNLESATKSAEYLKRNIKNFLLLYDAVYTILKKYEILTQNNKESFAFYCFYHMYLKLSQYIANTKDKELITFIIESDKTKLLLENLNLNQISWAGKIFYFLIKYRRKLSLYYYCILFNYMKNR